jgi:RNA polymerase sigma factor (sigma-70 family)
MNTENEKLKLNNFFKEEYRKLLNYVRKNTDERFTDYLPEDIVQDVAIGLLSRFDVNAQIENISAYIYRSLKNKIVDIGRKTKNNISLETYSNNYKGDDHFIDSKAQSSNGAFEKSNFETEILYEALDRIDEIDKEIIILNEFENYTYEQISKKLDIPVGTLLSRKHRALSKLHKIIVELKQNNDY